MSYDSEFAAQALGSAVKRPARRIWVAASIASLVGMITVNALANALPLNGLTTGAISDGYPIWFVPAGYVFSIWGLIYLALIAFTAAQALSSAAEAVLAPVRPLFVLSCIANGAWIFAWHFLQLGLSVLLMLTLLGSLIAIYRRLQLVSVATLRPLVRRALFVPMSLYLGWICVATIANVSALLAKLGWGGAPLTGPTWAAVMMVVATGIILTLALRFNDAIPPLVAIWAFVGIMVRFPEQLTMRLTGGTMTFGLVAVVAWVLVRQVRRGRAV